ncbi:MAG TPA: hypothetical protein VF897_20230 [Roseiflexaceae bacterium]
MIEESDLAAFADEQGAPIEAARALLANLRAQAGADRFYIFWTAGGGPAGGAGRQRTLLAFPTPDAALAFAQRNQLGRASDQPRLRRLRLVQLIQAMLREPAIVALLLVEDVHDQPLPAGQLPRGVRIERAELLRRLQNPPP